MRLTHLADYAVVILTAAAQRMGDERLSASLLSADTGVPLPTAQKVLGKLTAARLLVASRGAGGGFSFARPPSAITLADIIEAVEGPIAMTQCSGSDEASDCALDARCHLKPHMNIVSRTVRDALARVSLQDLCSPAQAGAQCLPSTQKNRAPALAGERA
jgi:FeS assembly SUF system regulator